MFPSTKIFFITSIFEVISWKHIHLARVKCPLWRLQWTWNWLCCSFWCCCLFVLSCFLAKYYNKNSGNLNSLLERSNAMELCMAFSFIYTVIPLVLQWPCRVTFSWLYYVMLVQPRESKLQSIKLLSTSFSTIQLSLISFSLIWFYMMS